MVFFSILGMLALVTSIIVLIFIISSIIEGIAPFLALIVVGIILFFVIKNTRFGQKIISR